jgi:uncharacterized repeat protein (TIGR01451 family)
MEKFMLIRWFCTLALFLGATPALAAPRADLSTSMSANQAPALVNSVVRYSVAVHNIGNRTASSVTVSVALPATGTSPQVYVYGQLGAMSPGCTRTGTTLHCALGNMGRQTSRTLFFDLALPVSERTFLLAAVATTPTQEATLANNTSTLQADIDYYSTNINVSSQQPNVSMLNQHCTGTTLTGWYECSLFPSSIASFSTEFHLDGSLSVPGEPDYFGTWEVTTTPVGNELSFELRDSSGLVASFNGWGADASCFEGVTRFPSNSNYVSPYRICPL